MYKNTDTKMWLRHSKPSSSLHYMRHAIGNDQWLPVEMGKAYKQVTILKEDNTVNTSVFLVSKQNLSNFHFLPPFRVTLLYSIVMSCVHHFYSFTPQPPVCSSASCLSRQMQRMKCAHYTHHNVICNRKEKKEIEKTAVIAMQPNECGWCTRTPTLL